MKMAVSCVVWFLLIVQFSLAFEVENLLGRRAPDFALSDLNGKMVKLSQFQGKVVVLVFWAFWCDTWKETSDTLKLVRKRFPPSSVQILCVAVDPSWKEIGQRMWRKTNGSFPILLDKGGQVSKIYGIKKVPTTLLIDKNGVTRFGFIGCLKHLVLEMAIQSTSNLGN
ncbi:MAG: TlpA family protein disulfide reductase [Armatimonadetes bacterium]|nr:TlpA family protein disulfide reductase [Armatimonadota bacterium]MDW8028949.1 TlpA disulfide reductase family protein [Armatimonadota bacterium]